LPFALWQDYWQGRLANFVLNHRNPQEEHVDFARPRTRDPILVEVLNERGGMQWAFGHGEQLLISISWLMRDAWMATR